MMIRRFAAREFIGQFINEEQGHWKRLDWRMEAMMVNICARRWRLRNRMEILDSEAIELYCSEGHVVICSSGGGVPEAEDRAG